MGQSIQTAVDSPGNGGKVLNISQFIQSFHLPEQPGCLKCKLWRRHQIGITNQINAELVAECLVIGASRELYNPAPPVSSTVTWFSIAELCSLVAGGLISVLDCGRPPDLLHKLQFGRFVSDLGQEGRRAQWRVDLVILHDPV